MNETTARTLTATDWIRIFLDIKDAIEANKDRLNELDGAAGDGDHGITMSIGFRAVCEALDKLGDDPAIDQVFTIAGRSFLAASGGAIGPLIGTMWTDAGKALAGHPRFGAAECRDFLERMENAVVRRGHAKPGDKTMLDALHPAVEAVLNLDGEESVATMLDCAAAAALRGAQGTAAMVARVGRSSRLGERSLGHEDAGANSVAIILRAMADAAHTL
jgi:dihydroxyacetone kinase phosphoprotein-dependent L subunit